MKIGVVLTTINKCDKLLETYFNSAMREDVFPQVYVIADRKTPGSVYLYCKALSKRGFNITCFSVEAQDEFLKGTGGYRVDENSDSRRNIGFLMAYRDGVDYVISIDDDNYCMSDFFTEHSIVTDPPKAIKALHSYSGWFNACSLIGVASHPRGFPYYARGGDDRCCYAPHVGQIAVNQGLWYGDPDFDAATLLVSPEKSLVSKCSTSEILDTNTWSPLNTQNIAVAWRAIPAFCFIPMGKKISGFPTGRYGDIFGGYFLQKCVKEMGDFIRMGGPIVLHDRNKHNCIRDLYLELPCIDILEQFIPWLQDVKLTGETYIELMYCLQQRLFELAAEQKNDSVRDFVKSMSSHIFSWLCACERLLE